MKNCRSDERKRNRGSDDSWLLQLNMLEMDFEEIQSNLDDLRENTPPEMVEKIFGHWDGSISIPITGLVSEVFSETSLDHPIIFYVENNEIAFASNVTIAKARLWLNDKIYFHTIEMGKWEKFTLLPVPQPYFLFLLQSIWVAQEEWKFKNGIRWEIIIDTENE